MGLGLDTGGLGGLEQATAIFGRCALRASLRPSAERRPLRGGFFRGAEAPRSHLTARARQATAISISMAGEVEGVADVAGQASGEVGGNPGSQNRDLGHPNLWGGEGGRASPRDVNLWSRRKPQPTRVGFGEVELGERGIRWGGLGEVGGVEGWSRSKGGVVYGLTYQGFIWSGAYLVRGLSGRARFDGCRGGSPGG